MIMIGDVRSTKTLYGQLLYTTPVLLVLVVHPTQSSYVPRGVIANASAEVEAWDYYQKMK